MYPLVSANIQTNLQINGNIPWGYLLGSGIISGNVDTRNYYRKVQVKGDIINEIKNFRLSEYIF